MPRWSPLPAWLRRSRWLAVLAVVVACGARSQLGVPFDPSADAGEDAQPDALPPIDGFVEAPTPFDCVEAGITYIYVITAQNELYSFYPPSLAFTKIGDIQCPADPSAQPYSMAVSREGVAYSIFTDGNLFRIDTANAACQATSYVAAASNEPFYNMGMGFAGDLFSESLYVADAHFNANSLGLATIDTTTFTRSFIANFQPELPRCELTGTGDGRLFAFCLNLTGSGSQIAEVDPKTAKVVGVNQLVLGDPSDAFAYAFWGGEFWIFTAPASGTSTVTRYDPQTHVESNMASLGGEIVGAGVSTCAPQ
ncbi:MAG TPA: hypothetical protein VLM85_16940 [Polyangiaceae bacterium]|nr:hypothetical protein [Polyangiaceae bacterium]